MVNETSDFEVPAKFRNDDLVRCVPPRVSCGRVYQSWNSSVAGSAKCFNECSNSRRLNNGKKSLVQFATRFK